MENLLPEERVEDRWTFPCATACGTCGYLGLPKAGGHPMRSLPAGGPAETTVCPHCNSPATGALDLANKGMARALVDLEVLERELAAEKPRGLLRNLLAGLVAAHLGALALIVGLAPVVGTAGLGFAAVAFAKAHTAWMQINEARATPRRWAYHPVTDEGALAIAAAPARGETIVAPLTGRECLGYEVRVAWNGASPTDGGALALAEQGLGTLVVGDHHVGANTHLRLALAQLDTASVIASDAAKQYLASRGLQPTDGAFDYYESIVQEGQSLDVLTAGTDTILAQV